MAGFSKIFAFEDPRCHGSATTTQAITGFLAALSDEFGIKPKAVVKWRKRQTVDDQNTGLKKPFLTALPETDEAMIVAFRRHTLLPLDECLYAL